MNSNHAQIVCGTDFSIHAREAATVAGLLARKTGKPLVLLHATEDRRRSSGSDESRRLAEHDLEEEVARVRGLGAEVRHRVMTDSPARALVEEGGVSASSLIVVASLGQIAPSRFLVGSVAERTAESAGAPTLVVNSGASLTDWLNGLAPLRILVAYDFSPVADAALRWAAEFSSLGSAEVAVVYVDWPPVEAGRLGLPAGKSMFENPPEVQRILERDVRERVAAAFGKRAVDVHVLPSWGRQDVVVLDLARKLSTDLVVMGTHQRHGLERAWLGSVSRGILRQAPMSVAVIPNAAIGVESQTTSEFQRVLVCTDFSKVANRAIPLAYAGLRAGGSVRLIYVVEPDSESNLGSKARGGEAGERWEAELRALIPPDAERVRGIRTEVEVVRNVDPVTGICQAAERMGADLICLSSHGRTGVVKALMGSVAQGVMRQSRRPVMVAPSLDQ